MGGFTTLEQHLAARGRNTVNATVLRFAGAAVQISALIGRGELAEEAAVAAGEPAAGQRAMYRCASRLIGGALSDLPVHVVGTEQRPDRGLESASLLVVVDPLDGAGNIATNAPMGTIFSLLPSGEPGQLHRGRAQLAAGFAVYGAYTALVLTLGEGVRIFTLDRETRAFMLTHERVEIPQAVQEYAINASNYRYWEEPVRAYVDDCIADEDHDRLHFNMRWIGSLVAEAFRILIRGGIFLYPRDKRPGFHQGRMRLVHAANPIALIMEQARGMATDGSRPILDLQPTELNEPVPLIFGSADHVARVMRYHTDSRFETDHAPLFHHRGLFQA